MWKMIKHYFAFISMIMMIANYAYANSSLTEQRKLYQQWQNSSNKMDSAAQVKLLKQLKGYPLSPYAQYNYLTTNIKSINSDQIINFINDYSDSPLAGDLQRLYVKTLNDNKQWQALTEFPRDNSTQSRCYYYFALYNQNNKTQALEPIEDLWLTGKELPSACDPILNVWQKSGQRTANLILLRAELALKANNVKLARYLIGQLPDNYKTTRIALLAALNDPKKLVTFSNTISYSRFTKSIVMNRFNSLARKDPQYALEALPLIAKQQRLSNDEQMELKTAIAWQFFSPTVTSAQEKWRDNIITSSGNTSLIERRIRQALRDNDNKALTNWINTLPIEDQNKDEWRYWRAVLLQKQGKTTEANALLKTVTQSRGFYAMLSAQKLGVTYTYDFNYAVIDGQTPKAEQTLLKQRYDNNDAIKRINELRYWGNSAQASREWRFFLAQPENISQHAQLARYAYIQGWGEHSVQATIAGKLWDNWVERFPAVYVELFKDALSDKEIPLAYSLAISRQESALEPSVSSPAGARGLMQLMPATAKDTARKISDLNYTSPNQLYDPETNIRLGTHFLEYVYQQFDKNRILASAAYNAGPNRVKRWLDETHGTLDAAAFIETIPFTETRNYVKSVLVYDYIYQLVLKDKPYGLLTKQELSRSY